MTFYGNYFRGPCTKRSDYLRDHSLSERKGLGSSLTCYKCFLNIGTMSIESVPHPFRFTWSNSKQNDSNNARSMTMYVENGFCVIVLILSKREMGGSQNFTSLI